MFKHNSNGNKGVLTITINTVYFHCIYCKYVLISYVYIQLLSKILAKEHSEYRFNIDLSGFKRYLKVRNQLFSLSPFRWE